MHRVAAQSRRVEPQKTFTKLDFILYAIRTPRESKTPGIPFGSVSLTEPKGIPGVLLSRGVRIAYRIKSNFVNVFCGSTLLLCAATLCIAQQSGTGQPTVVVRSTLVMVPV